LKIAPGFKVENDNGKLKIGSKENENELNLLPKGDWIKTAKDSTILADNILQTKLQDDEGNWKVNAIKIKPGEELENKNGKFVKKCKTDWENESEELKLLPGGNWVRNARNFELNDGILTAELKDINGNW